MDIFEQARLFPNADYYDFHTGLIYHIQEYTKAKKMGLPTNGIRISSASDGETIGYVKEERNYDV